MVRSVCKKRAITDCPVGATPKAIAFDQSHSDHLFTSRHNVGKLQSVFPCYLTQRPKFITRKSFRFAAFFCGVMLNLPGGSTCD